MSLQSSLGFDSLPLMLAQDGAAPPPPGEPRLPSPGGSVTGAPGTPGGAAPAPMGGQFLTMALLMLGALVLFAMLGSRRDKKKKEALLNSIKKHDKVQTIGGVIGSVVEIKSNTVVLKVDESSNTRMTFARSAIQQVLSEAPDGSESAKTS